MNIATYAHKFFIFGGILLLAVAALQLYLRSRTKGKTSRLPLLDATVIRVIFFAVMGILTLLAGAGVIPMTAGR